MGSIAVCLRVAQFYSVPTLCCVCVCTHTLTCTLLYKCLVLQNFLRAK